MEVNVSHAFKNLDGKPIKDDEGTEFTLKMACTNALLANHPNEKDITGTEKARRYNLAMDIHKAKDKIDLRSEDVTLLKELIAKMGSPLVVGQAYEILDPKKK